MVSYRYVELLLQLIENSARDFFPQPQEIRELSDMSKCQYKYQSHQ